MSFGRLERPTRSTPMGEINMTPLIDVMLVLLIIFMITAPMMNHGVTLDLPKVPAAPLQPLPDALRLSVDAKGQVYWQDAPVSDDSLATQLQPYQGKGPEALRQVQVLIRADASVPHGRVMAVLGRVREAGLSRISLETSPQSQTGR